MAEKLLIDSLNYKKIADIQLKVDKSEQERTDALKMLHANTTALEDK